MTKFILRRLGKGLLTIWFIWTLVFVLVRISGDPVEMMLPDEAQESVRQELRSSLGLDLPLEQQYIKTFTNIFNGDFGKSFYYKRSVADLYAERMVNSYSIALPAYALSTILGIAFGVIAAIRHDTAIDRAVMTGAVIFYTIPSFAFSIILIIIFSLQFHLLPSGNTGTWRHMVLPIVSLTVGPMATVSRLTRSSLLDVLQKEYLDGARMKGASETSVIIKHALRNSLIPVVTTIGLQLGTIIGGAVVVETVFAWPGIGTLLVTAANQRDFPVVQYGILLIAVMVTLANILVDVSYGWLDPRIRESFK